MYKQTLPRYWKSWANRANYMRKVFSNLMEKLNELDFQKNEKFVEALRIEMENGMEFPKNKWFDYDAERTFKKWTEMGLFVYQGEVNEEGD